MTNWCDAASLSANTAGIITSPIWVNLGKPGNNTYIQNLLGQRVGIVNGELVSEMPGVSILPPMTAPEANSSLSVFLPSGEYMFSTDGAPTSDGDLMTAFANGKSVTIGMTQSPMIFSLSNHVKHVIRLLNSADGVELRLSQAQTLSVELTRELPESSLIGVLNVVHSTGNDQLIASMSDAGLMLKQNSGVLNYMVSLENTKDSVGVFASTAPVTLNSSETHYVRFKSDGAAVTAEIAIDQGSDGSIDETRDLSRIRESFMVYLPVSIR
jgi:hypothetical protein